MDWTVQFAKDWGETVKDNIWYRQSKTFAGEIIKFGIRLTNDKKSIKLFTLIIYFLLFT